MNSNNAPAIPFDLIGFDLDGTMVDTSADIAATLNHTLSTIGRGPLSHAQVHAMVGGGTRHLVEQACNATGGSDGLDLDALSDAQLRHYETHIAVHSRPFDGLICALDALDARGIPYAVATNKVEKLARFLLDELGLLHRMAFVIGGDTLGAGRNKPAPDMLLAMMKACGSSRLAFVGDTIYDVKSAQTAGATSILVDFDRESPSLGQDHQIDHFDQLVPLLQSL